MAERVVELRSVWKQFGSVTAVRDCSLVVEEGEFLTLLGPSGSGKTTTLRLVAGFEAPTAGSILIRGRDVAQVPPKDRNISMVFQNYALFPHMTVFENVAFGLRVRRVDAMLVRRRVADYLELVRLQGYEQRLPRQLSGGQQQRVALARALITEPAVLLLDEPLGALDRKLREQLQVELKELLDRLRITAIYVTHDQDEALVMSDRVAVMSEGEIEQLDTPEGLYERPRTPFVATFVGTSNLFQGTVSQGEGMATLEIDGLTLRLKLAEPPLGQSVTVAIRPEKVRVGPLDHSDPDAVPGRLLKARYLGASTQYQIGLSNGLVVTANIVNSDSGRRFPLGEGVSVAFPAEHLRLLETPREPGQEPVRTETKSAVSAAP